MKICALQTVSANSTSVSNKNILPDEETGTPLFLSNILYANQVDLINETYIITNYEWLIKARTKKYRAIREDWSKYDLKKRNHHYECIMQGLSYIEDEQGKIDYLVILLGNNRSAFPNDLKRSILMLVESSYDSCMSVSRYNMFHPYRAFRITKQTVSAPYEVTNWVDPRVIRDYPCANDKDSFESAYFFNGSFWIVKRDVLVANNGIPPYTWLGNNIMPYVQDEGVMELDAGWQLPVVLGQPYKSYESRICH